MPFPKENSSKVNITKWDKIPFLTYPLFALVFIPGLSVYMAFFAAIVVIMVTGICRNIAEKESKNKKNDKEEKEKKPEEKEDKTRRFIFATIYALIAALAITAALDDYIYLHSDDNICVEGEHICFENTETIGSFFNLILDNSTIVLASFFAIGILYYHCGIAFFSTEAAEKIREGHKVAVFGGAILLFLEGIILYFAANSIDSLLQFSLWIAIIMLVDVVWVLVNIQKEVETLFQWLHFAIVIFLFLITLLLSVSRGAHEITIIDHFLVLIVLLTRTIVDYKAGWNFWGRLTLPEP